MSKNGILISVADDQEGANPRIVTPHFPFPVEDPWITHAVNVIKGTYGHDVSIHAKNKDLLKFGRNPLVGNSRATIMDLPSGVANETYVQTNIIDTVSSSDAGDTRTLTIEGHTRSGDDLTFVIQTITLTGQTKVTLETPLARMTRMYAPNGSTVDLQGAIYGYEDTAIVAGVPTDGAKVHCLILAGENQSRKASTSISSQDYWIVTAFDADCYEKSAGFAEIRMEVRHLTGVWRPIESLAVSAGSHGDHDFKPYAIVPPNSDVRLTAIADGANTDVGGMVEGVLASII